MANRYVVTRPYPDSGIGSNLSSLAGAVWIARALGRTLIVDWRGMEALNDKSVNYFSEFFEQPPEIAGVPVVYAGAAGTPDPGDDDRRWASVVEARALLDAGRVDTPFLALQAYHGVDRIATSADPLVRHRFLKEIYTAIEPQARIRTAIDDWAREHVAGGPAVGINLRTGNGFWFYKGGPYRQRLDASIFSNRRRLLRKLERACADRMRGLPRPLRRRYTIFHTTDAEWSHGLLNELPNAVARRTIFPPPGTGDHFADFEQLGYSDRAYAEDVIADMFLLARCDALVYNFSFFNQYAWAVTDYFGGNQVNIDSLYGRYWLRRARSAARLARSRLRR